MDSKPRMHVTFQAFISCRLDYCNSLRRLQSVQNAGACLVTGACRRDHITPVLRQQHCMPVRQRVVFKIAGLVHQSLIGAAPIYLADDCHFLSDIGHRPLWSNSNDMRKLLVLQTHNKLGDRSFSQRSSTVERPSTRTAAARTVIWLFQTMYKILFIWRLKCLATLEFIGFIQINLYICLSIVLLLLVNFVTLYIQS